jgi:Uma2 family endonuclease
MAIETRISNEAYERLALAEPDRKWELWDGSPREKPGMTASHNFVAFELGHTLRLQLDRTVYQVRVDAGRARRPGSTYFIPDVFVVPTAYVTPIFDQRVLEVYDQPLPLVVEVWSPTTGDYDVTEKLRIYQQRGDDEIWYVHPYERTLTSWRRQADGSYEETLYREDIVRSIALPNVVIDLAVLFDV